MRRHVTEEAKKQISELEEKVATSMAEISSLELQLVIDMPLFHFFQNLSFNALWTPSVLISLKLDQTGETAETTPIVYVPPATDQSDDVRVYLVPMIVRFSFLIRQRAHFGPFWKLDAAMKLKAQVSSLEAAFFKAQTGMVLSIRQNFHNIDLP